MKITPVARAAGAAVLLVAGLLGVPAIPASAAPCPDVEVVYARGTSEPVGVGQVGQAFVDALRAQVPTKSVAMYAVNYQASNQFDNRMQFAGSVVEGIRDAGAHVQATAVNCPNTRIVLGGFSQGAVVAGFVTSAAVPDGVPPDLVPAPLAPEVADHVAAVVLFGLPSAAWMQYFGAPPVVIGPLYADKTIQLCSEGDTICDGTPNGMPRIAHLMYGMNGMVSQAATFAANRLQSP
ncbi:cutinase family protein [Mycolicibacterium sp.]|uniref:cutinase family protein n=1 Tax=Mycolicibacterium sp. TaxID=2320850 RepID=UPI0028B13950|nr:cutinase family protein [Mycolicibacterium sp.]